MTNHLWTSEKMTGVNGEPVQYPVVVEPEKDTEQLLKRPCLVVMNTHGMKRKQNPAIIMVAMVWTLRWIKTFHRQSSKLHILDSCSWGQWGEWEDCSVTCGNGTQERNREITQQSLVGNECTGNERESRSCNSSGCPGKEIPALHTYIET